MLAWSKGEWMSDGLIGRCLWRCFCTSSNASGRGGTTRSAIGPLSNALIMSFYEHAYPRTKDASTPLISRAGRRWHVQLLGSPPFPTSPPGLGGYPGLSWPRQDAHIRGISASAPLHATTATWRALGWVNNTAEREILNKGGKKGETPPRPSR